MLIHACDDVHVHVHVHVCLYVCVRSCNVSDKVVSQGVSVTNDVETLQTKSLEHKTVA